MIDNKYHELLNNLEKIKNKSALCYEKISFLKNNLAAAFSIGFEGFKNAEVSIIESKIEIVKNEMSYHINSIQNLEG